MQKTSLLLITCALTLSACNSTKYVAIPCKEEKPAKIQTEEPGYFQKRQQRRLQNFNAALTKTLPGVTN